MKTRLVTALSLVLSLVPGGRLTGVPVWTEDFSGDLSRWSVTTKGTATMQIDAVTHALRMNSPAPGPSNEAWAQPADALFARWKQNQPYTIQFNFMIPDTNNHWFLVYADSRVHTVIDYNAAFTFRSAAGNTKVMDLNPGQWYAMRYEVSPAVGRYDIYVDDLLRQAGAGFLSEPWRDPFTIGDRPSTGGDFGAAYWDTFQLTLYIPEPSLLLSLATLALLGIRPRRRRSG